MGTTDINHLPYPELVDPPDIPADMKELADAVEALATNLSSNLLGKLKLPKVYQSIRTQDDGVPNATWGNAAGLFTTNVPKGTLLVQSVFHWKAASGYCWFGTKVNGTLVPYAYYIGSAPANANQVTTLVGSVAFPGGNLTVGSEFGFTVGDCWILNGSLVVATILPDAPTV